MNEPQDDPHTPEQTVIDRLVEATELGDRDAKFRYGRFLVARSRRKGSGIGRHVATAAFAPFNRIDACSVDDLGDLVDGDFISESRADELVGGSEMTVAERGHLAELKVASFLNEEVASIWWAIREVHHSRGQRAYVAIRGDETQASFVQAQLTYDGALAELKDVGYVSYSDFRTRRTFIETQQ